MEVEFPKSQPAYIVAAPETEMEKRVTERLSAYLEHVLQTPAKIVPNMQSVLENGAAIILAAKTVKSPLKIAMLENSPEAFALETGKTGNHSVVVAAGKTERGLKRAVQRLILKSEQSEHGLMIPDLHLSESPWIPQREWTICPWVPELVRGVYANPNADKRLNIWLYSDEQIARYVEMFDWFGFSGCQLMETCYSYGALGSPEAFQTRQKKFVREVRENGQDVTLWVWAAQFDKYNWNDPEVTYTPEKGNTAFNDPKVRAGFEKYYNHYAQLAPYVDRLMAHFYDPGSLTNRADVFDYMRLLKEKFRAKNPKVDFAVDFWAAGSESEYMQQLADHGFGDSLLLEMSMPSLFPAGKREGLHKEAKKRGLKLGVWGWYTTEYETDQMPMMHVNAQLLANFYLQIKNGVHQIQPISYWSEMEAYHLNNIFTMYAAGQLLWNPERDPHEILGEMAEGIWGPRNGPVILAALELIQDTRSGPTWETYWWTLPTHRLGTEKPEEDLRRAENALAALVKMKTDAQFVPKFPLPFPPATFVELILPHLEQIKQFARFRIEVAKIRESASSGCSKAELAKMVKAAWQPIPELKTWVGTFGQSEATIQEQMLKKLAKELAVQVQPPAWLVYRDADRLLQRIQNVQQGHATPWIFKSNDNRLWSEFYWPTEKGINRVKKLMDDGLLEKAGDDAYQLSNWEEYKQR